MSDPMFQVICWVISLPILIWLAAGCAGPSERLIKCEHTLEILRAELELCRIGEDSRD